MGLYKNNYNGIRQNICKSSKKILKISNLNQKNISNFVKKFRHILVTSMNNKIRELLDSNLLNNETLNNLLCNYSCYTFILNKNINFNKIILSKVIFKEDIEGLDLNLIKLSYNNKIYYIPSKNREIEFYDNIHTDNSLIELILFFSQEMN
tara:strand:- start:105 stop:557 length:453 start_codon:yes stop_codon:yes gene_type:complete